VEAPTHAELTTRLAAAADAMPKGLRAKIASQLRLAKKPETLANIAARIAEHEKPLPASHQPAGEMAFGDSAGVRLKQKGKAAAAKAIALGNRTVAQAKEVLGNRLYELQNHMAEIEFNGLRRALHTANNKLALQTVAAKLAKIETEIETGEPVYLGDQTQETAPAPGVALRRGRQGPAPDLIQIGQSEPFVSTTSKTSTPPHNAEAEAAILEVLEDPNGLPENTSEYMVASIYKYLDENQYGMAEMFISAAKQGIDISRKAMDETAFREQQEKINYQRPQKFADADIEGGVDAEMAFLQSAINKLAAGTKKDAPKLTARQAETLRDLIKGVSTHAQVRARTIQYLEANDHTAEVLDNALGRRANQKGMAEGVGENAFKATPEALAEMAAAVNALHNKTGASPEAAAEAVAESTITPVDEQAVLDKLTDDDKVTIGEVYEPATGAFSSRAKRSFLDAFVNYVNGKRRGIAPAIKEIIKRINAGVMALAMVMNPAALSTMSSASFAKFESAAQAAPTAEVVVPPAAHLSEVASLAYTRLAPTAKGRGLIIVDKPNGEIHFFDKSGGHITSGPVLTGASKEDFLPENVTKGGVFSDAQIGDIPVNERVTPAGVFTTARAKRSEIGNHVWLNNAQGKSYQIAIHDTYIKDRLPRFKTASVGDNMVSYGCVNLSPEMYEATLKNDVDKFVNNVVFVVPHDISKAEALLPKAQAQVDQRAAQAPQQEQAPPLRPPEQPGDPYTAFPVVTDPNRSQWGER
ncbi:MAG TPA: L,D-transpeptidase, partial [Rhizobacter sp.]|nr:L,D-transpeptidase [Rhizobacter sp.]